MLTLINNVSYSPYLGWTAGLTDRSVQEKCKLSSFFFFKIRTIYLFIEIYRSCAAVKLIKGSLVLNLYTGLMITFCIMPSPAGNLSQQ